MRFSRHHHNHHHSHRTGDTLIEVTLAVGIFSMVAIGIVAVMSGGTSSSQTALETTLAREEIDTQAEALRFIQSAYIADKDSGTTGNNTYSKLWQDIASVAVTSVDADNSQFITGTPSTCAESYNNDFFKNHAFIINPRQLSNPSAAFISAKNANNDGKFTTASTYPRLIFGNALDNNTSLTDNANLTTSDLFHAEGIYVIAVQDINTTSITDADNSSTTTDKYSAFYDFYIRTCWYGTGDETPSTIATVIRLYNPDTISTAAKATGVWVKFDGNGATKKLTGKDPDSQFVELGKTISLPNGAGYYERYGYNYGGGWSLSRNGANITTTYTAPSILSFNDEAIFYAVWKDKPYILNYSIDPKGGSMSGVTVSPSNNTSAKANEKTCINLNKSPSRDHYAFLGFELGDGTAVERSGNRYCFQNPAYPGSPESPADSTSVTLIAQWKPVYWVSYDTKSSWSIGSHNCTSDTRCDISTSTPTRSGYEFKGWCTKDTSDDTCPSGGTTYQPGGYFKPSSVETRLHAMWKARNETITIYASWTSGNDYDSYLKLQKPDSNDYIDATYGTTNIPVTYNGQTYSLITGNGDGRGRHNGIYYEKFTINTLGGKNYYYSIHNWSSNYYIGNDITVTVSGPYLGTRTFKSTTNSSCYYWNVFAYKDGQIVTRNTCSNDMQYGY